MPGIAQLEVCDTYLDEPMLGVVVARSAHALVYLCAARPGCWVEFELRTLVGIAAGPRRSGRMQRG